MRQRARTVARGLWRDRAGFAFIAPGYLLFLVVILLPVAGTVIVSFMETDFRRFKFVGLANYQTLLNSPDMRQAFFNTIVYVVLIVPTSFLFSLLVAFLIRPQGRRLQAFFRAAFYLPGVIGGVVLSLAWLWIYNPSFGVLNFVLSLGGIEPTVWLGSSATALVSVAIVVFTLTVGTQVIILLAGLAEVPRETEDAARVDGATSWQVATRVTLPMMRNVLAFVVIVTTIATFQSWEVIYLLTFGGPAGASRSIVFFIYQTAFQISDFGLASAAGVVLLLIIGVVSAVQLWYWREQAS